MQHKLVLRQESRDSALCQLCAQITKAFCGQHDATVRVVGKAQ